MRNVLRIRYVLYVLVIAILAALVFGPATVSPARASGTSFNLSTIVAAPSTHFYPPSPCDEGFALSGQFVISAQITLPGDPTQPKMLVNLHLDGTGIAGTGLTTGVSYTGSQGNDQAFSFDTLSPAAFQFTPSFTLFPPNPTFPPSPCNAAVPFNVNLFIPPLPTLDNPPVISATLASGG